MVQTKENPALSETEETVELREQSLKEILLDETHMIDDHGPVIFGNRIRRPIFVDDDEE
jgi:hypothetical protein